MPRKRANRRKFLQYATATTAFGLAGCQLEEGNVQDDDGGGRTNEPSGPIEAYLEITGSLGDAMASLDETNVELAEAKSRVALLFFGAIATGGVERYSEAPVPEGWDRRSIFGASSETSDRLAEEGYREFAPSNEQELTDAVEGFEDLAAESERKLEAVRREAEELREYWEENRELFDPDGEGATEVELDARFIDRRIPLFDSVWVLADAVYGIRGEYPGIYEDIERVSDVLTQDCELKCTEAKAALVAGEGDLPGIGDYYDHAWVRCRWRMERTCEALEPLTYNNVENWGFYGKGLGGVKGEGCREWRCETDEWVGTCADPGWQEMQDAIYENVTMDDSELPLWKPEDNCANWALDMLAIVDPELATDLYNKATIEVDLPGDAADVSITFPSNLCEGGSIVEEGEKYC